MDPEPEPTTEVTATTSSDPVYNKIHCKEVTSFLLSGSCAASLMHLSHQSEPYAHGAVSFLLVKALLRTLEYTFAESPKPLDQLNRTCSKLAKFVPLTLLNAELIRKSGLLNDWNDASLGLLIAASVPTALALTELKESHFDRVAMIVNGGNLLALGLLVAKQGSGLWGAGMGVVCAMDCFLAGHIARWVRLTESNTRNLLRSCFVGMMPFFLKSIKLASAQLLNLLNVDPPSYTRFYEALRFFLEYLELFIMVNG
ncbi:hypothetical protein quinque_010395 [Culex quinquefasciatus]